MRILFAGNLVSALETSWQRFDVMRRMGHTVEGVDLGPYGDLGQRRFLRRIDGRAFTETNLREANALVLKRVEIWGPDILWVDKGLLIVPNTLRKIKERWPALQLIAYQDDNPFGSRTFERPFWRSFIEGIAEYDLHFVKRSQDVERFCRAGAKQCRLFVTGFYEPLFAASEKAVGKYRHDVCFVGTAIDDRATVISQMMLKNKVSVDVYGRRWNRFLVYYLKRKQFHDLLPAEHYADVTRESRINLGFVSHSNCDEYNGRSFDIPASGGFFLAERTPAHQSFYQEGVEADFFSSTEELFDKISFYLKNEDVRVNIARRGYERCMQEDYSLSRRLRDALAVVEALK